MNKEKSNERKEINIFKSNTIENNVEIINRFFIKIKNIKEQIKENLEEINNNLEKINAKEITICINRFNQIQIESIINNIISNLSFSENIFLIKEELDNINEIENLKIDFIKNDDSTTKLKKINILSNIYRILKEITEEYFNNKDKYTNIYLNLSSDIQFKFFNFFLVELINISNSLYKHLNNLINDFYDILSHFSNFCSVS